MRQSYSVQVFLYRKNNTDQIEYLLFKRNPRPDLDLPDFWQGISGGIEQGETLEEAAIREVLEESSIRIGNLRKTGFISTFPIKRKWRIYYGPVPQYVEEHVFCSQVNSDPILSHEHNEFGWYSYEDAIKILTFGENRLALESVNNIANDNI